MTTRVGQARAVYADQVTSSGSSSTCRQLMQQKVQKSRRTILPRRSASATSWPPVLSQPRPTSSDARTFGRRVLLVVTGVVNTTRPPDRPGGRVLVGWVPPPDSGRL